jgi:hypothetical protein
VPGVTWSARVFPTAGIQAVASRGTTPGGRTSEDVLHAEVRATDGAPDKAWRAQLQSSPLQLSPDKVYSLYLEARSTGANATARLLLHSAGLGRAAGAREVALLPAWRGYSLRLVQPLVSDADPVYTFQARGPLGAAGEGFALPAAWAAAFGRLEGR